MQRDEFGREITTSSRDAAAAESERRSRSRSGGRSAPRDRVEDDRYAGRGRYSDTDRYDRRGGSSYRGGGGGGGYRRGGYDDRRGSYDDRRSGSGYRGGGGDYRRRDYDDRRNDHAGGGGGGGGGGGRYSAPRDDRRGGGGGGHKVDEVAELTRDARTVFVGQLVVRANERDVREFFEAAGAVRDVVLIRERGSNRSKGFGYVEMAELDDVPKALLLNGERFPVGGFPVEVRASEAEKNYARAAETEGGTANSDIANRRVFVSNLDPEFEEEHLTAIFNQVGQVEKTQLVRDVDERSRGYAFVVFRDQNGALDAMTKLHGMVLGERPMRVGTLNSQGKLQDAMGKVYEIDDGAGVSLSAQARAAMASALAAATSQAHAQLAAKLEAITGRRTRGTGGATQGGVPDFSKPPPGYGPGGVPLPADESTAAGAASASAANWPYGRPGQYLMLSGLFVPALESSDDWEEHVTEDVRVAAAAHGDVLAVVPDPVSVEGYVFVAMATPEQGDAVGKAVGARRYCTRPVGVTYLEYDSIKQALRALKGQGMKAPQLPEPVTHSGLLE